MVTARHLKSWGANPEIWLSRVPHADRGLAALHLDLAERFGIPVHQPTQYPLLPESDLLIDAMLGLSLSSAPSAATAAWIDAVNAQAEPVSAVDLPSGLDATSGAAPEPCIRAEVTLTFALPKTGVYALPARSMIGADIGVPATAYAQLGVNVGPLFHAGEFLSIV